MRSIVIAVIGAVIVSLAVSLSCFTDRDETLVTISLGDPAPSSIVKVHVAVFSEGVKKNNLVYSNSFDPGTVAQLQVPSGTEQYFVVIGEDSNGLVAYYGSNGPYNLEAGTSEFVTVQVNPTLAIMNMNAPGGGILEVTSLAGATSYEARYSSTLFYSGTETRIDGTGTYGPDYFYRAYFEMFNLYTDWYYEMMSL